MRRMSPGALYALALSFPAVVSAYDVEPYVEYRSFVYNGPSVFFTDIAENVGNPINVGLNNKYQEVIDIAATGGSPLTWSRYEEHRR